MQDLKPVKQELIEQLCYDIAKDDIDLTVDYRQFVIEFVDDVFIEFVVNGVDIDCFTEILHGCIDFQPESDYLFQLYSLKDADKKQSARTKLLDCIVCLANEWHWEREANLKLADLSSLIDSERKENVDV